MDRKKIKNRFVRTTAAAMGPVLAVSSLVQTNMQAVYAEESGIEIGGEDVVVEEKTWSEDKDISATAYFNYPIIQAGEQSAVISGKATYVYVGEKGDTSHLNTVSYQFDTSLLSPMCDGYVMTGWNLSQTGGDETKLETWGNTCKSESEIPKVIYAQWEQKKYDITYRVPYDDGTEIKYNDTVVNGDTVGYDTAGNLICDPADTYFYGWYTKPNGEGMKYEIGTKLENDTVLYANVIDDEEITFINNYDGAEVSAGTASEVYTVTAAKGKTLQWAIDNHRLFVDGVETVELPAVTQVNGYQGSWWISDGIGEEMELLDKSNVLDSTKTVYAKYIKSAVNEKHNIKYIVQYPEGMQEIQMTGMYVGTDDEKNSIDFNTYLPYGEYVFNGFYTAPNESGEKLEAGAEIFSDMTVYAAYDKDVKVIVKQSASDEGVWMDALLKPSVKKQYLSDIFSFPETIREGMTFVGWFTEENGGGTPVSTGYEVTPEMERLTIYPYFVYDTAHTFTVTFDGTGGSLSGKTQYQIGFDQKLSEAEGLPAATRTGYAFAGWFTEKDGGQKVTADIVPGKDVTYYAHWTEDALNITFDANGGSVSETMAAVLKGHALAKASIPTPVCQGKIFEGWFTQREGGEPFTTETIVEENMTVYAHWKEAAKVVTITWDANDGSISPVQTTHESGSPVGTLPMPERAGYKLDGWFTEKEAGTKIVESNVVENDVTFYAHWNPEKTANPVTSLQFNKHELEVQYGDATVGGLKYTYGPLDADNAKFYYTSSNPEVIKVTGANNLVYVGEGITTITVSTDDDSISDNCKVTVVKPESKVQKLSFNQDAYEFTIGDAATIGWTYSPKDAVNNEFVLKSSDPSILKITYDLNGDMVFSYGGAYGTATLTVATKDGLISDTCTVTVKKKINEFDKPDIDVYHTVSFDTQGGDALSAMQVMDGETADLPTPTKDGYQFLRWVYSDGSPVKDLVVKSNIKLYATWEEIKDTTVRYNITFDSQNGTKPETKTYVEHEKLGTLARPEKEGYQFLGWFDASSGGEQMTDTTPVEKSMTLYAQWKEDKTSKEYKLTLNLNGGYYNGSNAALECSKPALMIGKQNWNSLSALIPVRNGYKFSGWYTDKANGIQVYDENGDAMAGGAYWDAAKCYIGDGDLLLYAGWEKQPDIYTLYFETRGGNDIHGIEYEAGSQVHAFPVPEREGYRFLGWFTKATNGEKVDFITMDANATLYAHWKLIEPERRQYTITLDSQGGKEVEPVVVEEGIETELPIPEKPGYLFSGWFTKPEGEDGKLVIRGHGYQDMTLYAHWVEDDSLKSYYHITFIYNPPYDEEAYESTIKREVGDAFELEDAWEEANEEGYRFLGWFTEEHGGEKVSTYAGDGGDITLYAQWEDKLDNWTIKYNTMGGNEIAPQTVRGATVIKSSDMPVPKKEGYAFTGWYTEPEAGDKIKLVIVETNIMVYAHWEKLPDEETPAEPTPGPTETPAEPTPKPTETPAEPTPGPTEAPAEPTQKPTETPAEPTPRPTEAPAEPTPKPTETPAEPTPEPTETPEEPTPEPTETPEEPTPEPTETPEEPTKKPESTVKYSIIMNDRIKNRRITISAKDSVTLKALLKKLEMEADIFLAGTSLEEARSGEQVVTMEDIYHKLTGKEKLYVIPYLREDETEWYMTAQAGEDGADMVMNLYLEREEDSEEQGEEAMPTPTQAPSKQEEEANPTPVATPTDIPENYGNEYEAESESDGIENETEDILNETPSPTVAPETNVIEAVEEYRLEISNTNVSIKVKDKVTLKALTDRMGFTNITTYTVKTATSNDSVLSSETTMKEIAAMAENGEVLITAYDAAGTLLGSAKITKTGDKVYRVNIDNTNNAILPSNPATQTTAQSGSATGTGQGTATGNEAQVNSGTSTTGEAASQKGTNETTEVKATKTGDENPIIGLGLAILGAGVAALAAVKKKLKK